MTVKIYLRSIEHNGVKSLALFDSNGNGDINNLVTEVPSGAKIIWKPDCCSGIRSIIEIKLEKGKGVVFEKDPKKQFLCKGFQLRLSELTERKDTLTIKYTIKYIPCDGPELIIDPYIKIPPPPTR
jgi:hypothetical protein